MGAESYQKAMRTFAISLCLAFAATLQAQTGTSAPSDPVRILSVVAVTPERDPAIEVELYNQSAKGVVAFALILRGEGFQRTIRQVKGPEAGNDTIPDSTRWTERIGSVIPADHSEVFVDYVRFDDGQTWGPNDSHSAEWVEGFLAGFRGAKFIYRRVLRTEGLPALEADLKRE